MSVKRIILVVIAVLLVGGFIALGAYDAIKTKRQLEFQKVEVKTREAEVQKLNVKQEQLNQKYEEAVREKEANKAELDKIQKEKEATDAEKARLEAELQAKVEAKNRMSIASSRVTNAATGTQTASATSGGDLRAIVTQAANRHGLDPEWFWQLAKCESTWNPNAVNYKYYENGHPSGLYQHISGYWPERAAKYGYAGRSVFDAEANANVTAAMWASGSHLWECQ